jgi:hypothetical protein
MTFTLLMGAMVYYLNLTYLILEHQKRAIKPIFIDLDFIPNIEQLKPIIWVRLQSIVGLFHSSIKGYPITVATDSYGLMNLSYFSVNISFLGVFPHYNKTQHPSSAAGPEV